MAQPVNIYLQVQNQQQVQAALAGVTSQVNKLNASTAKYGASAGWSRKQIWLWNQGMFMLRRAVFGGTIAIVGLTGAVIKMGFAFNATMESNRLAFEQFLGSTAAANKELDYLYDIAKKTPFEFQDVTQSARRFLAFGYSVKEANQALNVIGDAVAAFGGGTEQIQRMTLVFGQIRATGRLLGQDMLQLEQQGIPVIEILSKQLNISREQLGRIGELGISASVGIPALMKGMQQMFGGAAARQAKSFNGQISTLRDNVRQFAGALTLSQFEKARTGFLPGLNRMFGEISDTVKRQQGKISLGQVFDIAEKHYPNLQLLITGLRFLVKAASDVWRIFSVAVIPAFTAVGKIVLTALLPALLLFGNLLGFVADHSNILRYVLIYLIATYLFTKTVTIALAFWKSVLVAWTIIERAVTLGAATAIFLYNLVVRRSITYNKQQYAITALLSLGMGRLRAAITATRRAWIILNGGMPAHLGKWSSFDKMILKVRWSLLRFGRSMKVFWLAARTQMASFFASLYVFVVTNPITLLIAAIAALVVGLVILYFKWKRFHDIVNRFASWVKTNWRPIVIFLIGPLGIAIAMITKWGGKVVSAFKWVAHYLKKAFDWAQQLVSLPGIKQVIGAVGWAAGLIGIGGGGGMPTAAMAGAGGMDINATGMGIGTPSVQGILSQPGTETGKMTIPVGAGKPGDYVQLNNVVQIDGKTVARQMVKYKLNAEARE